METGIEIVSIAFEAIPYVGGVLSSSANYFLERRRNRRLNDFLIALAEDLQSVNEHINQDFAQSGGIEDLAEDIFSKAAETHQKEKLDAFRALFLNTVLSDHPNYEETEEISNLIDSWQSRHIIILKILGNPRYSDMQMGNVVGDGGTLSTSIFQILKKLLPEWDDDQIDRTWQDLFDDRMHRTPRTRTMINDSGIRQLENRLTDFGVRVSNYLKNPVTG
jgi:hypothetical protein